MNLEGKCTYNRGIEAKHPTIFSIIVRDWNPITVEIGQHFSIHNVYRFLKHTLVIIIYKIRAYITMTSQIHLPNLCTIVHIL